MKLKHSYSLSAIGLFLTGFGAGWIVLSHILSLQMDYLTIVGASFAATGLAIIISTLSTIRKIEIMVDED